MAAGHYSFEASVIENGKTITGKLTLFVDEYVFAGKRTPVHWDRVSCEQGIEKVKGFLRTVEKPYVIFTDGSNQSRKFVLEQERMKDLLSKVKEFSDSVIAERNVKEEQARKEELGKSRQTDRDNGIHEESRINASEEIRQRKENKQPENNEKARQEREAHRCLLAEKQKRIHKIAEDPVSRPRQTVIIEPITKKAASCFLDNPYRTLGISCLSSNEEANSALDKIKKMARLKALDSYYSLYDLASIEKPKRELSVAQNAIVLLKDKSNKFFWFAESDACALWQNGKYRIELSKDGEEYGTYDLFLANYLYALVCDPGFNTAETWKRILKFYSFICRQETCDLLRSRFTERELEEVSNSELLLTFREVVLKPVLLLCERDDLDAVIRLHKYIKNCDDRELESLNRSVLSKLVSWFTDKEAAMLAYLNEVDSMESISSEKGTEIKNRGENYCRIVEPVFQIVLRDFGDDAVRYDMIKESYRHTTYQFMYELNKCTDKSAAILFANKCYGYCNADDKKRIQNTFGAVNIKSVDWNIPHTGWDAKGDDYYFGRGCPVDYTQALYWYHKAAEAGNMYSPNSIGICYQEGHGVPQNDKQAVAWFEKAYNAGNPQGAYNLAECYFNGTGVRRSVDQALKFWADAAKLGHPSAAQRRESVFSKVQVERKNHRARNHMCHDIGFQMITGANIIVEITLSKPANAYLVNAQGYQNYLNGNDFKFYGGFAVSSPYRIIIPSSNHWYVIVDNGDAPIVGVTSSVKVKRA